MPIKEIELVFFRNHECLQLKFNTGINVIWGENGSGKTAVLEAIHTLSLGRSFRTSHHREMIMKGQEHSGVDGLFEINKKGDIIRFNQTEDGRRKFFINDRPVKGLKELIGRNPVVVLSPEEQVITQGDPAARRTFFDRLFSVISKDYVQTLLDYNRALKQRNTALSLLREAKGTEEAVLAWNDTLINLGTKIWLWREKYFKRFSENLTRVLNKFADSSVTIECFYNGRSKNSKEELKREMSNNFRRDMYLGRTTLGPHRDKYSFGFQGHDLKQFGSQGEHKLTLVFIKLAEFYLISETTGDTPTFLLDDLFAKLDFSRSENIVRLLETGVQTIITTTDLVHIEKHGIDLNKSNNKSFFLERPCKA